MTSRNAGFSIFSKRQIMCEEMIYIWVCFPFIEMINTGMGKNKMRNEIVEGMFKTNQNKQNLKI